MSFGPALALVLSLAAPSWALSEFDKLARAGLKALQDDDAVQAEVSLQRAARLKPENADIHAALALALSLNHERPQAREEYKTALRLDRRYVEGRKITDVASSHRWLKDAPGSWDGEQDQLAIEVLNEPKTQGLSKVKPTLTFPKGWVVDGPAARPDDVRAAHARITYSEGKDDFEAEDAADWFEKARKASPDRYRWFKQLDKRDIKRGPVPGVQLLYMIHPPRFREDFEVLDVILLDHGRFRRAIYEAPESEFKPFFDAAYASLETLK